jgi:Recombination endonuclease VII
VSSFDKECPRCEKVKPVGEFGPRNDRKGGTALLHRCKECRRELTARWRAENPEKNIASKRIQHLKRYNLDEAAYSEMGDTCWICGAVEPGYGRKYFFIDHDHACCPPGPGKLRSCGKCIRGLLCGNCNLGLSLFRDDPKRLRKAADYIEGECS